MMCTEDDLKSIGLPLGPRKKLMGFLKEHEASLKAAKAAETVPAPEPFVTPEPSKPVDDSVSIFQPSDRVFAFFVIFDQSNGVVQGFLVECEICLQAEHGSRHERKLLY